MKILFVCENYFPHVGGAEVVFKNLAERYVKLGHKVTILTHRLLNTPKLERINGVKIIRVESGHSRYIFTFSSIFKAISLARKHDLIQTTSFNGAPCAWLAGKITQKPVVITVHEVWVGRWKMVTGFSWLNSQIHELLEKAIYALPYDRYICVSNATKNDLLELPVINSKVETIYNGFDDEFWSKNKINENASNLPTQPQQAAWYKTPAVIKTNTAIFSRQNKEIFAKNLLNGVHEKELPAENNFVFFSWGRAGPSKGFELLINAIPKICANLPQAKFRLMFSSGKSGTSRRKQLRQMIKNLNLGQMVEVINPVPYVENRNYIASADSVIIPSLSEGFGYAALEAAALGTPVLVSSAGSLPEIVSGKYLIFENGNVRDLVQKALMMAKGNYHQAPFRKFPWETCVNKYLEAYRRLVMKKKLKQF